jgi:hypothetical protein
MRRGLCVLAVLTAISSFGLVSIGQAAELELSKRYVSRPDCDHSGCREWRGKRARCPDRFSCYPLYGAYDPYGGPGYWGAYSYGYDYYVYR